MAPPTTTARLLQSEDVADLQSHAGQQKRNGSDKSHRPADAHSRGCQRKGHTDRQCINTGRHCQQQHGSEREGIVALFAIARDALPDHIPTDQRQQNKRDPVVKPGDVLRKG